MGDSVFGAPAKRIGESPFRPALTDRLPVRADVFARCSVTTRAEGGYQCLPENAADFASVFRNSIVTGDETADRA